MAHGGYDPHMDALPMIACCCSLEVCRREGCIRQRPPQFVVGPWLQRPATPEEILRVLGDPTRNVVIQAIKPRYRVPAGREVLP